MFTVFAEGLVDAPQRRPGEHHEELEVGRGEANISTKKAVNSSTKALADHLKENSRLSSKALMENNKMTAETLMKNSKMIAEELAKTLVEYLEKNTNKVPQDPSPDSDQLQNE